MSEVKAPNYELAEKDYTGGMKYRNIATKYDVTINTVKSWKTRYKWSKDNKKGVHTKKEKVCIQKKNTKPIDDGIKGTMLNENLTHEQRLFCIYYSKSFNAAQSYQKAYQCTYESACSNASTLWKNSEIKQEVQRLNALKCEQIAIKEQDIVELHMRIAFSDIGDYLSFGNYEQTVIEDGAVVYDKNGKKQTIEVSTVSLKESSNTDTQLISEVKQGRDGVSIKLFDKQKSMDWLDKHFLYNPLDRHKIDFDNKKLELEYKKMEPDNHTEGVKYTGIPATMIAPAFIKVIHDIEQQVFNEYVFPGGRGSTKSSFISLEIVDLLEKNPDIHAAVFRQVGQTLRDSVYAQMCWAISALGLEDEYKCNVSPMEITKKSTGQKIFFRGNDDPMKSKGIKAPALKKEAIRRIKVNREKLQGLRTDTSMKVENGYIGILWFEELDQFKGEESVRTVTQSVVRGGEKTYIFKSFNPPKSANNWANKYIKIPKASRLVTWSTYLDVPKQWLGKPFLDEADFLKEVNPTAYENEYMGIANGTGGAVFDNIIVRAITDDEIKQFDRIYNGVDWGFYPDLYSFVRLQYEPAQHRLYIWQEYTSNKQSNRETADKLLELGITANDLITCDSSENKSVGDYRNYGLLTRSAIKGPDSRKYSYKWLQSLKEIIIDNVRCPEAVQEFLNYEYDRDKEGNVISGYPDGNDHVIDAVRYATESIWKKRGQ
jgi:PBSX family phage terminase large subunit